MMNGTCMLEAVLYMQDDMVEEVPIDDDQPSQRAGDAERDVSYKTCVRSSSGYFSLRAWASYFTLRALVHTVSI